MRLLRTFWSYTGLPNSNLFHDAAGKLPKARTAVKASYLFVVFLAATAISEKTVFSTADQLASQSLSTLQWPIFWAGMMSDQSLAVGIILMFFLCTSILTLIFHEIRVFRLLTFLGALNYVSLVASYGATMHMMHITVITLGVLVFLPNKNSEGYSTQYLQVFWWTQLMAMLCYSISGVYKLAGLVVQLSRGSLGILAADALPATVANNLINSGKSTFLGEFVVNNGHVWGSVLLVLATLLELYSLIAAFRPRTHIFWGVSIILMHIAILLTMGPDFRYQFMTVGILLILSPFKTTSKGWYLDIPVLGSLLWYIKSATQLKDHKYIIYYDGDCAMCNTFVSFLLKRKARKNLYYSAQSTQGFAKLKEEYPVLNEIDSIVVYSEEDSDNPFFIRTRAILFVLAQLNFGWLILCLLLSIFPTAVSDLVYELVAVLRKRIFAKKEDFCVVPDKEYRDQFIY